jgi:hypothetical protein
MVCTRARLARPAFSEYLSDRQQVVGGANLEVEKAAFAQAFVGRAEFMRRYQLNISAASFVNALLQNVEQASGIDLGSQREALSASYNTGASLNESRSLVVRELTESVAFRQAEYNAAFCVNGIRWLPETRSRTGGLQLLAGCFEQSRPRKLPRHGLFVSHFSGVSAAVQFNRQSQQSGVWAIISSPCLRSGKGLRVALRGRHTYNPARKQLPNEP